MLAGADQLTLADALPDVTNTPVTVDGTWAAGVPATLVEGSEVPTAFVALTVTPYSVPLVSPEMRQVVVVPSVAHDEGVSTPSSALTVYDVIYDPLSEGAVHETDSDALPAVTDTDVGASGAVASANADGARAARLMDINNATAPVMAPVRLIRELD